MNIQFKVTSIDRVWIDFDTPEDRDNFEIEKRVSNDLKAIGEPHEIFCGDLSMEPDNPLRGSFCVVFLDDNDVPNWIGKDKMFKMNGYTLTFEKNRTWKDDFPQYKEYFAQKEKEEEKEKERKEKEKVVHRKVYPYT